MHAACRTFALGVAATAVALSISFTLPAAAQKYPDRPVKIVLPFGPGGVADVTARLVAEKLGDKLSGRPDAIIDTLFKDLAVWSDQPRWAGSGFTRLVIELADLPGHPARTIARRHKALLEAHFSEMLASAGVARPRETAREIWLLSEGAISLILVHRDRSYAAAAALAAKKLLRLNSAKRK